MKWSSLIILFFSSAFVFGQEMLVPLTGNTTLLKKSKIWKSNAQDMKSGDLLTLPFIDDFAVDRFPGNEEGYIPLWENRSATRNTGWGKNPPTLGVVSLDGADEVGYPYSWNLQHGPADTLLSCAIDLTASAEDGIGLSFYYQPRGNNYYLNNIEDSLMLEFYAPELDQWFMVWSTSDISSPDAFTFVYLPITLARYLKEGFQFRFTNIAPLNGAVGTWNLDYIWLDQNSANSSPSNNDVAFVNQRHTFLNDYTAMPRDHYATNPVSFMRPDIKVLLRNLNTVPRTLAGNQIRILYQGTELGVYPNANEPGIAGGDTLPYTHNVGASPNNIVFDASLSDTELEFEVQILHGVSDFSPTATNDTMRFKQNFFTKYAYDDGQAEYGYAYPTSGASVALKYLNYKSDSIFALSIYTMPIDYDIENSIFNIKIWEDSGNGPGTELGTAQVNLQFGLDEFQESLVYTFDEPVYVPSGSFFVGYTQTTQTEGVKVGIDINTNANPTRLYYKFGSSWNASSFQGSLMLRPMFTSNGYQDIFTEIEDRNVLPGIKIYPNPANDFVVIQADTNLRFNVSVYDISGRMLSEKWLSPNSRLDISTLQSGVYILMLEDENGRRGSKKLIVNK
ncbi:T9SS type A sorting domain-containing protein [Cryomorpha ignava]|uniref:T9SS type A sorting domain-containing protein n=1 Tax=Cryomorpha ignava TaxID=101383 RepID=A0A7K3WR65_9FLAO|nr:T9SS type A sorting domain-containing protein [Cryomorpha ignava]NEN24016.1 T9SS type A sorting domain-containing protein [Cryomorpha ignava]